MFQRCGTLHKHLAEGNTVNLVRPRMLPPAGRSTLLLLRGRIHQPEVQKSVFEDVLQIAPEETQLRFGYMLEAFRYGAPPQIGRASCRERV